MSRYKATFRDWRGMSAFPLESGHTDIGQPRVDRLIRLRPDRDAPVATAPRPELINVALAIAAS